MERIERACGENVELFWEVDSLLMENCYMAGSLIDVDEFDIDDLEENEGLIRSVHEYYYEDFSLMKCKNVEHVKKLLEDI